MRFYKSLLLVSSVIALSSGFIVEGVQAADPEADAAKLVRLKGRFTLEGVEDLGGFHGRVHPLDYRARDGGLRDTAQYSHLGVGQLPAAVSVHPYTGHMPPSTVFAGRSDNCDYIGLGLEDLQERIKVPSDMRIAIRVVAQNNRWAEDVQRGLKLQYEFWPMIKAESASYVEFQSKIFAAIFELRNNRDDQPILPLNDFGGERYQMTNRVGASRFSNEMYSVHNEAHGGEFVSSGATPLILGIEDREESHYFYSVAMANGIHLTVITLHCLLNDQDYRIVDTIDSSVGRYGALIDLMERDGKSQLCVNRMRGVYEQKLARAAWDFDDGLMPYRGRIGAADGRVTPLGIDIAFLRELLFHRDIEQIYRQRVINGEVNSQRQLYKELAFLGAAFDERDMQQVEQAILTVAGELPDDGMDVGLPVTTTSTSDEVAGPPTPTPTLIPGPVPVRSPHLGFAVDELRGLGVAEIRAQYIEELDRLRASIEEVELGIKTDEASRKKAVADRNKLSGESLGAEQVFLGNELGDAIADALGIVIMLNQDAFGTGVLNCAQDNHDLLGGMTAVSDGFYAQLSTGERERRDPAAVPNADGTPVMFREAYTTDAQRAYFTEDNRALIEARILQIFAAEFL